MLMKRKAQRKKKQNENHHRNQKHHYWSSYLLHIHTDPKPETWTREALDEALKNHLSSKIEAVGIGNKMKHSYIIFRRFSLLSFFIGILLLCMNPGLESATAPTSGNETDRLVLLDFKNRITQDPTQIMRSWNGSVHFCNWVGVTCSPSFERVTILNLQSQKLVGSIPPSIGNLTFLTGINLLNNSFHGEIPQEMGRLLRLQHLIMSANSFVGKIPTNLTHCTGLREFSLARNELTGEIPDQLSSLTKLSVLILGGNNLTGSIPAWIGNFSSLFSLSLARNNLGGVIPNEFSRLSRLKFFQLFENRLSGTIPSQLYNISSIYYFEVAQNLLHGRLPPDVGLTLPNLEIFTGGANNFTGPIPLSLSNASRIQSIDFAENSLTGTFPSNLGNLKSLYKLNFDDNLLGSGKPGDLNVITALANCTNLEALGLAQNRFGGELPNSIENLSKKLKILTMGGNLIHGSIPVGIGNLVSLTGLGMERNLLTGSVPEALGKLQKLEGLYLNNNKFSGKIPFSFGNLTSLTSLEMQENRMEGNIPPSLGNCQKLLVLNLSSNNLSGNIPKEVIGLSSLSISLVLSHNSLTGLLPFEVGRLKNLVEFDISDNKLSGEIPSTMGSCVRLERLHLERNLFRGMIPKSLEALRGLEDVDLSRNNFSGTIPDFLGTLSSLRSLNLSFNDFEGEVPREGIFANASLVSFSFLGNDKLCGAIQELHLPACSRPNKKSSKEFPVPRVVFVTASSVFLIILLISIATCYMLKKSRRPSAATSSADWSSGTSYLELAKSTNGFSEDNLIGSGSFGSVYKGLLPNDNAIVAVKVLNLQQEGASKSFIDECTALRNIRHRNLLKIITVCSSVDHQGNDFKAIVFEFMSNGNLDQWLHHPRTDDHEQQYPTKCLSFMHRLNIAIDVASALDYLHHDCETSIVHCDMKPSNVLLDDDMTAHVGDFGLARFIFDDSTQTMSVGLKGSIGYIPPEYGTGGQVSIHGDVYSYGILLLEMFTGKRPTDEIFKDGLSIHEFVSNGFPEHITEVVDPLLISDEERERDDEKERGQIETRAIINEDGSQTSGGSRSTREECLVEVMGIGISCSRTLPGERMTMKDVVNRMHVIRNSYIRFKNRSGRVSRR